MPQGAQAKIDDAAYITDSEEDSITAACDGLTASVVDRRENGGTHQTIRARALDLIRVMVADLETE